MKLNCRDLCSISPFVTGFRSNRFFSLPKTGAFHLKAGNGGDEDKKLRDSEGREAMYLHSRHCTADS